MAVAEFKSWFEAGILVRGRFTNQLKGEAWRLGLEFEHERAGSVVRFKVWGDPAAVTAFQRAFAAYGRSLMMERA